MTTTFTESSINVPELASSNKTATATVKGKTAAGGSATMWSPKFELFCDSGSGNALTLDGIELYPYDPSVDLVTVETIMGSVAGALSTWTASSSEDVSLVFSVDQTCKVGIDVDERFVYVKFTCAKREGTTPSFEQWGKLRVADDDGLKSVSFEWLG